MDKNAIKKSIGEHSSIFKDRLINPISEVDFNIIKEIREIFKKLKYNEIVAVLDGYKYYKDEEIYEKLLEWNTNYRPSSLKQNDIKDKRSGKGSVYVRINDWRFDINDIFSYDKYDTYISEENTFMYGIYLNETPLEAKQIPLYANKCVFFYSEEERDNVYDMFDTYLLSNDSNEFLN